MPPAELDEKTGDLSCAVVEQRMRGAAHRRSSWRSHCLIDAVRTYGNATFLTPWFLHTWTASRGGSVDMYVSAAPSGATPYSTYTLLSSFLPTARRKPERKDESSESFAYANRTGDAPISGMRLPKARCDWSSPTPPLPLPPLIDLSPPPPSHLSQGPFASFILHSIETDVQMERAGVFPLIPSKAAYCIL
ncbi:hypothetical protein EYF80_041471 [Liparis tanakae]|uniref:Uncharacterized protein n=1 Tax=Liparis tanakae TaxID=230148 RepID=A0A4Z2G471_9TELE|nr:hypothetical protein EYF80_041471 [Liparis tanakae]